MVQNKMEWVSFHSQDCAGLESEISEKVKEYLRKNLTR